MPEEMIERTRCPCSFSHPPHDSCDGNPDGELIGAKSWRERAESAEAQLAAMRGWTLNHVHCLGSTIGGCIVPEACPLHGDLIPFLNSLPRGGADKILAVVKAAESELQRVRNFLKGSRPGSPIWVMLNAIETGLMEALEPEKFAKNMAAVARLSTKALDGEGA